MKRKISAKHAEWVAWLALALSFIFACLCFLLEHLSNSQLVFLLGWHFLGGIPIWFLGFLHNRQKRLAEEEKTNIETTVQSDTSLFKEEQDPFSAQARLSFFEKWIVPIGTLVIALIYLLGGIFFLYRYFAYGKLPQVKNAPITSAFLIGFAFFSLLLSKYALGMARQRIWRTLRAGSSYLFSNAGFCFIGAIFIALTRLEINWPENYLAAIIPIFFIIISIEIMLNLLLDIYRPRVPGQEPHFPYDSRLLHLCTGSQGILRTAAHTLDYQFGFKVSETWFYQFMERTIAPLILFQVLTLYLLTCIVIVRPSEQAVIERFGKPLPSILTPGLYLKWPWPIENSYHYPVKKIETLVVGMEVHKKSKKHKHKHQHEKKEETESLIFTDKKHHDHHLFLLAHKLDKQERQKNLLFRMEDFKNIKNFIQKIRNPENPLSHYIFQHFDENQQDLLRNYDPSRVDADQVHQFVLQGLNEILEGPSIYRGDRFEHVRLPKRLLHRTRKNYGKADVMLFNRLLLEYAYLEEIDKVANRITIPVNLYGITIWMTYCVDNILYYLYEHATPKNTLRSICYRELTVFFATITMEQILGADRFETAAKLRRRIQRKCRKMKMGIKINSFEICAAHPPTPVANSFIEVIGAMEEEETKKLVAEREREKKLPKAKS